MGSVDATAQVTDMKSHVDFQLCEELGRKLVSLRQYRRMKEAWADGA